MRVVDKLASHPAWASAANYLPLLLILAAVAIYQFAYYQVVPLLLVCASIGFFSITFSTISFKPQRFNRRECIYMAVVACFFLSSLYSYALLPSDLATFRVKRFALLAVGGIGSFLFIHQFVEGGIKARHFSWALVVSTVVTGLAALYTFYFVKIGGRVALGPNYPTIFGDIIAVNAVLCMYLALNEQSRPLRLALVVGMLCALLGAYASGTRGAWLSLLLIIPLTILFQPFKRRRSKFFYLTIIICCAATVLFMNETVLFRLTSIQREIDEYIILDNPFSSNGLRIEFWRAGLLSLAQSPWFGSGDQYLGSTFADLIESGTVIEAIGPYQHVHNDFLQLAHSKGIFGILLYVALIALPPLVASPGWRRVGILLSVSYALFGFTDCLFIIEPSALYYFFISAVILSLERTGGARTTTQASKQVSRTQPQ